jgi:ABC-2 type transport system ATP-binding protein
MQTAATPIPAIEVRGLTKRFGRFAALDGVDLSVREGSVFGFLGPNGAGKTTTLRILTGLTRPTSGRASILGHDVAVAARKARESIGYLPEAAGFYDWMSAEEFVRLAGRLFGLRGILLDRRVHALLDMAGLAGVRSRIGTFSRGMKQRLGIAQALINAPKLLLLDEPTSALDPIGRKEALDMIASLAGRTTVFFSTHILSDVERVCDTVAILNRGRIVTIGNVEELKARGAPQHIVIEVDGDVSRLEVCLVGKPWLKRLQPAGAGLRAFVSDLAAAQRDVPKIVSDEGLALRKFELAEVSLEDVFVDVVG